MHLNLQRLKELKPINESWVNSIQKGPGILQPMTINLIMAWMQKFNSALSFHGAVKILLQVVIFHCVMGNPNYLIHKSAMQNTPGQPVIPQKHFCKSSGSSFSNSDPRKSKASHTINLYHYNTHYQQEFTICDGESISVGKNVYTKSGLYTDSLFSYNACDSIVQTQLNILENKRSDHQEFICYADSFRNVSFTRDTSLEFYFQAANGCDSTEFVELKVNPALAIEFIATPACPEIGGSLEAAVRGGSGQNYQYTWSNGKRMHALKVWLPELIN